MSATAHLTLKDFEKIWTKFCFLDETGTLHNQQDPYFTVGLIKMSQPYYLQSKILYERNRRNFHDELKFNTLSRKNVAFAQFAIDALLDTRSISFYSYTTRKDSWYFQKYFNANPWHAYEQITLKLLDAAWSENEILILIADHVTTPKHIKFEVNTKRRFNQQKQQLALAGVVRFDSKSNDLLQIVDLFIGSVTYDLKLRDGVVSGSVAKQTLLQHLKDRLGITSFAPGYRKRNIHIFVEQGG